MRAIVDTLSEKNSVGLSDVKGPTAAVVRAHEEINQAMVNTTTFCSDAV
jgi:hypothetical protein